jgi:hypothetical protein
MKVHTATIVDNGHHRRFRRADPLPHDSAMVPAIPQQTA